MSTHPSDRPAVDVGDDFAVTIADELVDGDDPEALPGAVPVDERPLQSLPTIGHVGRYALKYQLGAGGLGTVYAALDPLLSRPIAVKTLHVDAVAAQREVLESQLLAEARAAAGLNHQNIVTVFDAGLADQGVYIAMERLQGRDLRHLLADGWRPEPVQAARIAKRVADALAYAHSHGVIHCDIKPANIFMIGRTQPKVLDFGIARVAAQQGQPEGAPDVNLAAGASVPPGDLGSPYYVAPEQLRGQALDLRCDVYGVGVVLYELLTGRRAFGGHSLESIRQAVLESDVAPVHLVNRNVNVALSAIVARAMARNPVHRYRSARQLVRALRGWLEEEASQQAASPLGHSNWAWATFAGLGLGAAVTFWVLATGSGAPVPPEARNEAAPVVAVLAPPAPALPSVAPVEPPAVPARVGPTPVAVAAKSDAVESARARDRRLAREAAAAVALPVATQPPVQSAPGIVQLAISPWGQVEVNGVAAGTTPPLSRLTLAPGKHQIVVRNDDFPPLSVTVTVADDKPVTLRHRFGS